LPEPLAVNGVQQRPIEGVSMLYSFNDPAAAERRETQYFELSGNRGIYHQGWTAVTRHRTPWLTGGVEMIPFDDDVWELYDTSKDWTQANDIAQDHPERLRALQRLWLIEATKYNVLPLDDRFAERANPEIAGRPQLITGTRQILFGGMGRLTENSVINTKNKSHAVTAEVVVPPAGAEGVIVAMGGITGGWSLYAREGKPKYCYNFYGIDRYTIDSSSTIAEGVHQVRMEFNYDGGGLAKGGKVTLYLDGEQVGEGRVDRTEPILFSATNRFSGEVTWVEIDLGEDAEDNDHLISPAERLRVAMAIQ
jgi:hypothetical protein